MGGRRKTSPALVKAKAGASFFSLFFLALRSSSIAEETTISGRAGGGGRREAMGAATGSGAFSTGGRAGSPASAFLRRRRAPGSAGSTAGSASPRARPVTTPGSPGSPRSSKAEAAGPAVTASGSRASTQAEILQPSTPHLLEGQRPGGGPRLAGRLLAVGVHVGLGGQRRGRLLRPQRPVGRLLRAELGHRLAVLVDGVGDPGAGEAEEGRGAVAEVAGPAAHVENRPPRWPPPPPPRR